MRTLNQHGKHNQDIVYTCNNCGKKFKYFKCLVKHHQLDHMH